MSYYSTYRWCAVPECKNTSVKTPNKLWIQAPTNINMRKTWFKVARRNPELLSERTRLYFCEDHFDLEHDMENYIQYKIMGSVKRIRLKPDCIPTRFDWNRKHKSTSNESHFAEAKRLRISMSEDSVQDHIKGDNVKPSSSCVEDNFDPETSARERRKLNRKSYFMNRKGKYNKTVYNERGQIAANGKDMCDCLDETCPGCHFPCPKCDSNKCGIECRVNRKWMYERIEVEGSDFVIKNEYKK